MNNSFEFIRPIYTGNGSSDWDELGQRTVARYPDELS